MQVETVSNRLHSVSIKEKIQNSTQIQCYIMLALPLIGFLVFTIYPLIWSIMKAFFFYTQVVTDTRFVGMDNFITIFTKDTTYWNTWITTFKFALYKIPFEIPMSLILALMLSKKIKGAGLFRTIYYMPCLISVAIVGIIFTNLFEYYGFINSFCIKQGLFKSGIDWFSDSENAMIVLVVGSIWANFGINVLYFSAALTNVPDELYEAAEIEGAGSISKFFHITIPMIAPVFQTILLLAINGTLQVSEYIIVMTNGAPGGKTNTVGAFMINQFLPGFSAGVPNIGYGCAMSIINSIIYSLIAIIYIKASKKMVELY